MLGMISTYDNARQTLGWILLAWQALASYISIIFFYMVAKLEPELFAQIL